MKFIGKEAWSKYLAHAEAERDVPKLAWDISTNCGEKLDVPS